MTWSVIHLNTEKCNVCISWLMCVRFSFTVTDFVINASLQVVFCEVPEIQLFTLGGLNMEYCSFSTMFPTEINEFFLGDWCTCSCSAYIKVLLYFFYSWENTDYWNWSTLTVIKGSYLSSCMFQSIHHRLLFFSTHHSPKNTTRTEGWDWRLIATINFCLLSGFTGSVIL